MTRQVVYRSFVSTLLPGLLVLAAGCGGPSGPVELLAHALDSHDGLMVGTDKTDISTEITTDGGGSLHIYSDRESVVNLFEIPLDAFVGDTVIARCKMKSESLSGWTTLELWVFPEDGQPRAILKECKDIGRTRDWQDVECVFPLLERDLPPAKMRLAIRLGGRGHLWTDEIEVIATTAGETSD